MFPFFSQGAAQAIEDGAALAQCLADDPHDPVRASETMCKSGSAGRQRSSNSAATGNTSTTCRMALPSKSATTLSPRANPLVSNPWLYVYDAELAATEALV